MATRRLMSIAVLAVLTVSPLVAHAAEPTPPPTITQTPTATPTVEVVPDPTEAPEITFFQAEDASAVKITIINRDTRPCSGDLTITSDGEAFVTEHHALKVPGKARRTFTVEPLTDGKLRVSLEWMADGDVEPLIAEAEYQTRLPVLTDPDVPELGDSPTEPTSTPSATPTPEPEPVVDQPEAEKPAPKAAAPDQAEVPGLAETGDR